MEGRCESNRGGDEVYPTTVGNEEKTGLKLVEEKILATASGNKLRHSNSNSRFLLEQLRV